MDASGLLKALWLRRALAGLSIREAERELRRRGYSKSRAMTFLSRHKHRLGLRNGR